MFNNRQLTPHQHLFFSPHLDDVVLSCGGLVAGLTKTGAVVKIVTIFAGEIPGNQPGAFARHLHAKWDVEDSQVLAVRRQEDMAACRLLNAACEHWNFPEAVYRCDTRGLPQYCSYESLAKANPSEPGLQASIMTDLQDFLKGYQEKQFRLYFPLGLAQHVDHQLLAKIGLDLSASYPVWFYEEWPYVEQLTFPEVQPEEWERHLVPVDLAHKTQAAACYATQIRGLGGDVPSLTKRLEESAIRGDEGGACERYWELTFDRLSDQLLVFNERKRDWRLRDYKDFLRTLKDFSSVRDFIPPGRGLLLDVGCGSGRYCPISEAQGYDWIGLDVVRLKTQDFPGCEILGDGGRIPLSSQTMSAVLAWCVLAYLTDPGEALQEMNRVLKPGGLLVGMVSFLEPVHGRTYSGLSPLGIQYWLEEAGFEDIRIEPGLNGFSLMLWTWLRRFGNDRLARLAFPLTKLWLAPLMGLRFLLSWAKWRFFGGSGYGMQWVTEKMPLTFAGHLVFTARKGIDRREGRS
jgi:LmbE family N-acetylglucosaminyl deacetylase